MKRNLKVGFGVIAASAVMVAGAGVGTAQAGALITSAKIKDGTIRVVDLSPGVQDKLAKTGKDGEDGEDGAQGPAGPQGPQGPQGPAGPSTGVPGPQGPQGARGPAGEQGPTGAQGQAGRDGLAGAVYRTLTYTNGGGGSATVACADDDTASRAYTAIAGGVQGDTVADQGEDGFAITASFPGRMDWDAGTPKADRLDGWIVLGNGEYTETLTVWALCVPTNAIPVDAGTIDN